MHGGPQKVLFNTMNFHSDISLYSFGLVLLVAYVWIYKVATRSKKFTRLAFHFFFNFFAFEQHTFFSGAYLICADVPEAQVPAVAVYSFFLEAGVLEIPRSDREHFVEADVLGASGSHEVDFPDWQACWPEADVVGDAGAG